MKLSIVTKTENFEVERSVNLIWFSREKDNFERLDWMGWDKP